MILEVFMNGKDVSRLKLLIFVQLKLCKIKLIIDSVQGVRWFM